MTSLMVVCHVRTLPRMREPGGDHVSPLSAQAVVVLKGLQRITSGEESAICSRTGAARASPPPNRLTYAMRDMNLGQ